MPYRIRKRGNKYEIVRLTDNKVVGRSDTRAKARASIGYRMRAHKKKKK